uniref:Secreted protein n=1 Tax=Strongyloides papillosus TaxID=174720 RepID=A0A0N5BYW3_STREA
MNRILQLVWILVTYSIITESIDLKSLFEDLSSYKAENYNKPINTHIVKSDTKVIAVKCYNTNQNKQHNYNNVQRNFTYTPNKSNNKKRITIDFTDSDYFWTVSTISKSGDQDISCGILQVNTNVHELKYKYTIPDENNITKLWSK